MRWGWLALQSRLLVIKLFIWGLVEIFWWSNLVAIKIINWTMLSRLVSWFSHTLCVFLWIIAVDLEAWMWYNIGHTQLLMISFFFKLIHSLVMQFAIQRIPYRISGHRCYTCYSGISYEISLSWFQIIYDGRDIKTSWAK